MSEFALVETVADFRQLDDGEPLAYGKSGFANREFVACGLT